MFSKSKNYNDLPAKEIDGTIFTIKDIIVNKEFKCDPACWEFSHNTKRGITKCDYCVSKIRSGSFACIEIIICIAQKLFSRGTWGIRDEEVVIVDSDGYSHKGKVLCKDVLDERERSNSGDSVHRGTRVNVSYIFRELEPNVEISSIIVCDSYNIDKSIRFSLNGEVQDGEDVPDNSSDDSEDVNNNWVNVDYYRKQFIISLNKLKVLIYRKNNNRLFLSEIMKLEDQIETMIYSLSLDIESKLSRTNELCVSAIKEYEEIVNEYRSSRSISRIESEEQLSTVSELYTMDPFKFEHLCASLLEKVGFNDVFVTQKSGDGGIDINAYKKDKLYVAQCKRYQKRVGSPDMQQFIGAMYNARAVGGIFITTSSFTDEASRMARDNNVDLWDVKTISKLLSLNNDLGSNLFE